MRFRTRILLALLAAALIPLTLLAYGVRREMTARLETDAARRAEAVAAALRRDLAEEGSEIAELLATYASTLSADNGFRLAVLDAEPAERRRLLDWAGGAMRAGDLDLLRLYDAEGRILSSGHFRNEYDRVEPLLPEALARAELAVARVRGAADTLVAMVASDSFRVGGARFTIVAGRSTASLIGAGGDEGDVRVRLALPGSTFPGGELASGTPRIDTVAAIPLPFLDAVAARADTARFLVSRDPSGVAELRRRVDLWIAAAVSATLLLSLALAAWLAARISRPITELAEKTREVDLDRLDQRFGTDRDDEIGALAGLLDAMTVRLRRSSADLRAAERRAATGDLARQVNHDIRNGLAPIRHVLRHLTQVAEREPAALATVYGERRGTLESSVEYLDGLAREYARLSPALDRSVCRPDRIMRDAADAVQARGARVELQLAENTPAVRADAIVLRRIVDNLVANAVESFDGAAGTVTLSSARAGMPASPVARLTVADTGAGMTREQLDRAFEPFYTTKASGTGLGLSVVRRLVQDLGGTLRVETAPGAGSRFIVDLPAESET